MATSFYTVTFDKNIIIGTFDTLDMALMEYCSAIDYIKESGDFKSVTITDETGEIFDKFVA